MKKNLVAVGKSQCIIIDKEVREEFAKRDKVDEYTTGDLVEFEINKFKKK